MVNHRKCFVRSNDRSINTQKIERQWRELRSSFSSVGRKDQTLERQNEFFDSYISFHVYKQRYLRQYLTVGEKMYHFLKDIAQVHPGPFSVPLQLKIFEPHSTVYLKRKMQLNCSPIVKLSMIPQKQLKELLSGKTIKLSKK